MQNLDTPQAACASAQHRPNSVQPGSGWLVLASDASHYYENLMRQSPFPIVFNVGDMLDGFDKLRALADSADHIVPGHDPQVRQRYPFYRDSALDVVALHETPRVATA